MSIFKLFLGVVCIVLALVGLMATFESKRDRTEEALYREKVCMILISIIKNRVGSNHRHRYPNAIVQIKTPKVSNVMSGPISSC